MTGRENKYTRETGKWEGKFETRKFHIGSPPVMESRYYLLSRVYLLFSWTAI